MRDSRGEYTRFVRDYSRGMEILRRWEETLTRAAGPGGGGSTVPNVKGALAETYYGNKQASTLTTTGWWPWHVPKNASVVMLTCLGGAGGGGGGFTGATSTGRGGGSGGGSGAVGKITFPAIFLPKILHFFPGNGGKGGNASGAGVGGGRSLVSIKPGSTIADDLVMASGSVAAGGGLAGTAAGGTAGGTAESVGSFAMGAWQMFGTWTAAAGQAGSVSGVLGGTGASITWGVTGIVVSGGTGGGSASATNTDGSGGAFNGGGGLPIPSFVASAGAGFQGVHGETPWFSTGGGGGGSGAGGGGGPGGAGAYGSGGGGGGGGITGATGGDGGPGLINVLWW